MNTIKFRGKQRSTVSAPQKVTKRKPVFSPYWDNNVNPYFPYGCSKGLSRKLLLKNNPVVERISLALSPEGREKRKKRHLAELKQAKAECVNRGKMTTVFSTAF